MTILTVGTFGELPKRCTIILTAVVPATTRYRTSSVIRKINDREQVLTGFQYVLLWSDRARLFNDGTTMCTGMSTENVSVKIILFFILIITGPETRTRVPNELCFETVIPTFEPDNG